jgi:hypothetical protein
MSRTWSDNVKLGTRVAAVIGDVRHEGVVVGHSSEVVKFRDDENAEWIVSRDQIQIVALPKV